LIQRCQEHKRRNVLEHLPEDMHASVKRALKDAWSASDADLARKQLGRWRLRCRPSTRGSGQPARGPGGDADGAGAGHHRAALYRTLRTTNPIENLNGSVAYYCRNVKRWGDGQMVLRWVASALSDAAIACANCAAAAKCAPCSRPSMLAVQTADNGAVCRRPRSIFPRSRHRPRFNSERDIALVRVNELPRIRDRFLDVKPIIYGEIPDLPAVNTAILVEIVEERSGSGHVLTGLWAQRAAERHRAANADLGRRYAAVSCDCGRHKQATRSYQQELHRLRSTKHLSN
jgi:hypothetical protein